MPNSKDLTLKQWAYSCMSPEKAKDFMEYFEGRLAKIIDKKVRLLNEEDIVPENQFFALCDDYEKYLKLSQKTKSDL